MSAITKVVLLLAVLAFASVQGYSEKEYKATFSTWMHEHQRVYTSAEFQTKYETFKKNMDFVQQWNADSTHTHTVELNKFADLTVEEYSKLYLGAHFDASERLANAGEFVNYTLPEGDAVNWADKGAVTPVKDQGQCGSCWSFSTTGSVEALNFIYTRNLISLSEQNLMDCSTPFGPQGCNGGWMDDAYKYIISNKGIDREENYPYETKQGPCRFNAAYTGASMNSYGNVQSGNEGALVNAVNQQPISVAIDASHSSFQLYKSGIYYEPSCSSSNLDHAVLVIGYGSDNGDYFIVKNSWGTGWGMSGYLWMSRNRNNNCGIASAGTWPNA